MSDLTPAEALAARNDLNSLFAYLSVHGFTKPIPSIVTLMCWLENRASEDAPVACWNCHKPFVLSDTPTCDECATFWEEQAQKHLKCAPSPATEDECPDCNDGILTRAFAIPHEIPCPTCNGTMKNPAIEPVCVYCQGDGKCHHPHCYGSEGADVTCEDCGQVNPEKPVTRRS